jgi:hypothetical protein
MSNNSINYALFLILLAAVALDVYLSANVALQMVCILLAVGLLAVVAWIAFKLHLGTYVSNEQADNLQSYLSANIKLTNELKECERQLRRAKQQAVNGSELQNLVLANSRLTAQISNLQLRVHQQAEYNNELKIKLQTAQSTPIVQMATSEQVTTNKLKKQKSA